MTNQIRYFYNYKKLLFLLILSLLVIIPHQCATAMNLNIDRYSQSVKMHNKVIQPLTMNFVANSPWKLVVCPLDSNFRNIDNSMNSLPLSRLEISQLNGIPLLRMESGKEYEIQKSQNSGNISLNFILNIALFDSDYPGAYLSDLKFTLINTLDNSIIGEDIYNLRFLQDSIAKIEFQTNNLTLQLNKDKILKKNSSQNLSTPFGIYVSSNKNWKLYLKGPETNNEKTLKYLFKVLPSTDSLVECIPSLEYRPVKQEKVLIAKGKATINPMTNNLEKKIVNIDYMVRGPEDKYIPSGSSTDEFEYILESED